MDKHYEQLPPVLMSKLYNSTMKSNQKNKYHKQTENSSKTDDDSQEDKASLVTKTSTWGNTERRSTNDRRKQMAKRGRWLDSRDSTDRRKVREAVSITI